MEYGPWPFLIFFTFVIIGILATAWSDPEVRSRHVPAFTLPVKDQMVVDQSIIWYNQNQGSE